MRKLSMIISIILISIILSIPTYAGTKKSEEDQISIRINEYEDNLGMGDGKTYFRTNVGDSCSLTKKIILYYDHGKYVHKCPNGHKQKWKSSKPQVVSVSKKGVIRAKKAGKAVITLKCGTNVCKLYVLVEKNSKKFLRKGKQLEKRIDALYKKYGNPADVNDQTIETAITTISKLKSDCIYYGYEYCKEKKLNVGREPRFYLTVMWNRQWYHQAGREVQMMSNEQDGGPTHDAPQNGYLNRKKVSLEQNNRNGIHPYRPGILYRLGEAYLNYAEALNECDPGNPDILKYLNLIRERAGMPQYGTGKDSNGFDKIPLNGQDEVREAIYHERRVELCCENGLRYLDLRRWKKAEEVLNQPMYGMNFSGTKLSDDPNDAAAFFKRTQYIKRVYERKFYWYPIYQEQIDKDPTLVQAPFWDK